MLYCGRTVATLKAHNVDRNKGIYEQVEDPKQNTGETDVLPGLIFEPHPPSSSGADGDGLKVAQEASGAERKAPGHSADITDKFAPCVSQDGCYSPD